MQLVKPKNIEKEITEKFSYDFVLADDGLYLIEIIASAKSWWQNLKSFKSFLHGDNLALVLNKMEISTSKSNETNARAAWHGNELKGFLKTVLIAIRLKKGKHSLSFTPSRNPYLKSIAIKQIGEANTLTYTPSDKMAQKGDSRPWLSYVIINLAVSNITIYAKADKRGRDDDDIKLIIDGEIQKNPDEKSHKNWYWCGKVSKGAAKELKQAVKFNGGMHTVDLWADESPFLEKIELALNEENMVIVRPYLYKGPSGQEDYNRFDEIIRQIVNHWNREFSKDIDPVQEVLDPNLVKAMIFQESRVGYDNRNNGTINIMQVGNDGDPSLDVLNGMSEKPEYELKNGRLWKVNYEGQAKVEKPYDSIYWGVRWLYHKAQGVDGSKRYWRSWKEAVQGYGPPNEKYSNNVWDIYLKGIDKRSKPPLKLWTLALILVFSSIFFSIDSFNGRTIKSTVMASVSDDDKMYFNDAEIIRYADDSPLFLAVMIHDDDWWESLKAGVSGGRAIKWLAIGKEPSENSILTAKFLRLKGFANPLVEVYGQTHVGHGSMYLYEVKSDHLVLLFKAPGAVDLNPDISWAPDNHEKYGYGNCGEIFTGGKLAASYDDINNDGHPDIILSGQQDIICEKEITENYPDHIDEVKAASLPVKEVYLWNERRSNWNLE